MLDIGHAIVTFYSHLVVRNAIPMSDFASTCQSGSAKILGILYWEAWWVSEEAGKEEEKEEGGEREIQ